MVEKIIELCARNRLVVLLGVGFALVASLVSIKKMKLDAIPDLSDPQVIVFTDWMGRSPTLVEDQVTYPIVSKLIGTPHVTEVRGFSMFGKSIVYVIFEEGTDIYWARSRVLEYMNGLRGALPEGVSPTLGPDATGIGWTFQYTLTDKSGKHSLDELRTFQDFTLRYALGSVPGVAEVASVGGYQKQYQVTVDPNRLRAYGVTLNEVMDAIRQSNNDVGGRIIELSGREYYVRGRGYIHDLGAIEKIAPRANGPGGTPLLVKDVAAVRFGPDIRRGLLEWNGEGEAVGGVVVMRYGENALDVIGRVKKKIEDLKPSFPDGVELTIAYDRSGLIERSIDTLKHALTEEAIVVSVVIMLFLLHLRSALLPILSLPISVALAFIPMALLDIPSTIMSLGGIAIAIGATVDAQIVMIEAAHKKLEDFDKLGPGADRHRLLIEAAKEVTPAIFFSLLIIAVAFLPVFTLTGQAGRLFKPLAYTKTFVMLISALLSITFAPALQDIFIRGKITPEKKHPVSRFLIRLYEPFVYVALRRPKSTVAIGLFALASAVPVAMHLGNEFMPPLNEGDLLYMPITFPNISIEEAKRQLQYQDRLLRSFPEVKTVFGKVGRVESATDPAPITMVETTVQLRPAKEWRKKHHQRWYSGWAPGWLAPVFRPIWPEEQPLSWEELTTEMNSRMQFPGWTNAWTMPIKTRVDMLTTGVRTPIGIKVFGTDLYEVEKVGVSLEHLMAPIKGTRSVLYERNLGGLYLDIIPKPDELARYGLHNADVERVIESAIGGAPIGTTIEGRNRFSINVRYPQDLRSDLESLRQVLVPIGASSGGATGGGGMPMGTQGALETAPAPTMFASADAVGWPRPIFLAQNMAGMAGGASSGSGADMARPRLPSGPPSASDMPMAPMAPMSASSSMGGLESPPPMPGAPPAPAARSSGRPSFVPLGQIADIKVAGGPHGARRGGPAGRLRLRRHRSGPARHRRLRERGEGRRRQGHRQRRAEAAPRLLPEMDRAVRAARRDAGADEGRHPRDAADHRAAAVPAVQELRRGLDHPVVDPVRADRQRLADMATRLSPVDGGVGRHHRARRAGGADRHRDDRLHRPLLQAAQGGRPDPQPRRHRGRPHGGNRPARAPKAHDGVDDADRPRAAALGAELRRRRHEADRGADGRRPAHVRFPDAGDHPGHRHLLAPRAAPLGAIDVAERGAPPAAPEDRCGHRGRGRRARRRPRRRQHLSHVPRPQPGARRNRRRHRLPGRRRQLRPASAGRARGDLAERRANAVGVDCYTARHGHSVGVAEWSRGGGSFAHGHRRRCPGL